jgi:ethanolaminephosphotransferase
MRDIVKVTFGEYNFEDEDSTRSCEDASSDGERLHCRWVRTERLLGDSASGLDDRLNMLTEVGLLTPILPCPYLIFKFLRDAQAVMSGTASNYDILELQLGVTIATLAAAVAIINLKMTQKTINLSTGCIIGIAGIYGVLMFASSYVEEEHHFWYWITCGWLCVLYLVQYATGSLYSVRYSNNFYSPSRRHRTSRASRFAIMELLITVRIVRRWNQTGQKYAGAPDIGKTFLPQHNIVLWTLVGITFLEVARRLVLYGWPCLPRKATGIMALILTLAAVSFKLAFAIADAPELLVGFPRHFLDSLEHMTLISLARTVFAGIGVSIAVGLCRSFYIGSNSRTIKQGTLFD